MGLKPRPSRTALRFPFRGGGVWLPLRGDLVVSVSPFRGKVSFANVKRACWASSTVPVTLELFNH